MAQVTLKGNPIHTSGELPAVGTEAPDFELVDAELNNRSLKDYKGKIKIVSIVPSLDTSTCSTSAKTFNEKIKEHPDIMVIVVSTDLPFAQKRFCSSEEVKNIITLSMMRDKKFGKSYGVLITDGPLAGICARAVLVLDQHNHVRYVQLVPEITHEPDYDKALNAALHLRR